MFDAGRRPIGWLFYCAVMVAMIAGCGLRGNATAVPQGPATTTVADTVYLADGTYASGTLIITWPAFVTAGGTAVASGVTNVTLGANGALSVALVPNAGATPAGMYYTVVYQIGSGEVKTEYWLVPTTSPVNLAGVITTPGSGVAAAPVSMQYVNSQLATVVHLAGAETVTGTKTFSVAPNVPTPANPGDVANKSYVDSAVSNVGAGNYVPTAGGTMTGPLVLPGSPSSSLQAADKGYVDLGLATKADLISGLVPTGELGAGSASASTCLLGNGTWGPCASGSGTGNVSTNPLTGVSQNITQQFGTQFSTNNLAGIPYVVASYNWPQGGSPTESCTGGCVSGALVAGTAATVTLTPCPAGVDTSNNTNAPYGIYIAGTGTPEAVAVTGGSCTSGASTGTIVFTPGSNHAVGFTVAAANGGNQEAINVGTAGGSTHAVIQELPTGGADTANYNIYWPVFLKASKSVINGDGALWRCYTRSLCLMVGDYLGSTGQASIVRGLEFQPATNVGGAQIASVSATTGLYTVNTASAHNLVTGDWVILYYTNPAQTQEVRVKVTVTSTTQFQYTLGATTFALKTGFGWVAIENAAIEVETDGARLQDIKYTTGFSGGLFHQGVVVGNDQHFMVDGMTNEGSNFVFRCDSNFCGNMIYLRGDQGAAPVAYLHHLEASFQCSGNGVRSVSGNTLDVQDSVIQGTNQYAIYYAGGLQPWSTNNVYNESGACTNPFYPGSQTAIAGYIAGVDAVTLEDDAPIGGAFPTFVSGGSASSQRNYYVVPKDSNLGTGPMMFIGNALPATSGTSIPLYWPSPDLAGAGTRTFDILVTLGPAPTSAPYTGNAFSVVTGIGGSCSTTGICTYTDTQGATTAYTVQNALWTPTLPFWPGSLILSNGASAYINQCGQASTIISTSYLPKVFCKRGVIAGSTSEYTPYWGVFMAGDSAGNGNQNVGAQVVQIAPASGSWNPGISGALNFNPGPGATVVPRQVITTMDGSPQQTFATPGYVRTGSAGDSFIGTDSTGAVGTQDQSYGAPGGHNFYVNDPGTNSAHAKFNIGASAATFNVPVTVNGSLAVTSGSVTLPITGSSAQCLHVSSTGVVTGTAVDCGGGMVSSGVAAQIAMYSASGAAVSGDSALTDNGSVLNYAGTGGISTTAGAFSGNLTVNGQLLVAGPWMVSSPIPGTAMAPAGTGTSALGISNDGNFYISANAGTPQMVATTATSSYFSNLMQEDANDVGEFNGTNPQNLHVYSSYTNSSSWQRTSVGFDTGDNYAVLRSESSTGGAAPGLGFWINSGLKWVIDSTSNLKPWADEVYTIGTFNASSGVGLRPATVYAAGAATSNSGFELGKFANNSYEICNDTTSGTAPNGLAVLTASGCAVKPSSAVTAGVIGVVAANAGNSGTATVALSGSAYCSFDATATVVGDYVVASSTANGGFYNLCHDAGSTEPTGVQVLGRVLQATSGSTTVQMFFNMPGSVVNTGATSISSVFGRTGAVVAASGDYSVGQVTGAAPLASPTFTGTPLVPTAAGQTNTTQAASTAYVMASLPPANTPFVPFPGYNSGSSFSFPTGASTAAVFSFNLPYAVTTSKVAYKTGTTADSTSNNYAVGIYNSSGTLVLSYTAAGTSFASAASTIFRQSWTQGSTTLAPGKYYLAMTSNCVSSCATFYGSNGTTTVFYSNTAFSVTTGGVLPSSISPGTGFESFTASILATIFE
ncbi:MAG TPA: hypothetical protein VGM18_15030 [Candidatus Sulfotelmatobacter sp.]